MSELDFEAPVADVNQQPVVLQRQLRSFEQSGDVMQSRLANVQLTGGKKAVRLDVDDCSCYHTPHLCRSPPIFHLSDWVFAG
jgi:hypothetical protein